MKNSTVFNFIRDYSPVTQQSVQALQIAVCKETGSTTQSLTTYISFPPMQNSSYTRIEVTPSSESVNISVKIDNQPMQTVQSLQSVQEVKELQVVPQLQQAKSITFF